MCKYVGVMTVLMVLVVGIISGCGQSKNDEELSAIFLVGNHANSTELPLNDVDTYNLISNVMDTEAGGTFSVIEIDGKPYEVVGSNIPEIQSSYSKARKDSIKAKNVEILYQAFNMAVPKEPEVDTLAALIMAGERASASAGETQIIILDNGIITTGEIDGATMFNAESDWIVDKLKERNCLPNLEGANITWIGVGDLSAGDQKALSEGSKRQLKDAWKAIIEAAGGHVEFLSAISLMERSDEGEIPKVTEVEVPEEDSIRYEEGTKIDLEKANVISEQQLRFAPDSAELTDKKTGRHVIEAIVSAMNNNPQTKILVAGSVAGDSDTEYAEKLSAMRAETIKSLLVRAGIDEKKITTIGLAAHSPWRIEGLGVGPEAAPNRHVVVIDLNSATAQQLLNKK